MSVENRLERQFMHIFTVDVEDWFHTFDARYYRKPSHWGQLPSLLERNVERIGAFLSEHNIKATFFWLGWSAEKHKTLIRKLADQGHEIGAHSYHHLRISDLSPEDFRADTEQVIKTLEDITGNQITAYRAPGFSVSRKTCWAFEILSELGIKNDSSLWAGRRLNSGKVPGEPFTVSGKNFSIREFPVVGIPLWNRSFNYSGSGYFRVSPFHLLQRKLIHDPYVMYYFHPRDFDEGKIRKPDKHWLFQLRYGLGTKKTFHKLDQLSQKVDFINLETAASQINWDKQPRFTVGL